MIGTTQMAKRTGSVTMLIALAAVGCGGAFDATVSGVVTLDGEPLERGTITFSPTGQGSSAYAKVDDSGGYRLRTGRELGLPPGEYQVTVIARERSEASYGKDGGPPPAGKLITPDWYRSEDTSGLSFTVAPGSNEIDLALSSEPPPGWDPRKSKRRRRR